MIAPANDAGICQRSRGPWPFSSRRYPQVPEALPGTSPMAFDMVAGDRRETERHQRREGDQGSRPDDRVDRSRADSGQEDDDDLERGSPVSPPFASRRAPSPSVVSACEPWTGPGDDGTVAGSTVRRRHEFRRSPRGHRGTGRSQQTHWPALHIEVKVTVNGRYHERSRTGSDPERPRSAGSTTWSTT